MLQGKLSFNKTIVSHFEGINWKELNKKYKADYGKTISSILAVLEANGVEIDPIQKEVNMAFEELPSLKVQVKRGGKRPGKSG